MTTTYERTSDSVVRVNDTRTVDDNGNVKGSVRENVSRAYSVYRFRSSTHADAAATVLSTPNRQELSDDDLKAILKDAAMDQREFLHVSEAAQVMAEAQLRAIGSRPTGKHVQRVLDEWNGQGYIAIDDIVVALPQRVLPSHRATVKAATKNAESVPSEWVDAAHDARVRQVEARSAARALRGPVEVKLIAA